MEIKLLKESLIKFLERERLLTSFSNNLEMDLEFLLRSEAVQYCKSTAIRNAFYWSATSEGYEFWKRVSGRWSAFLFEHKYIYRAIEDETRNKISTHEILF